MLIKKKNDLTNLFLIFQVIIVFLVFLKKNIFIVNVQVEATFEEKKIISIPLNHLFHTRNSISLMIFFNYFS